MKHSLKDLTGYTIGATDGELGKVTNLYFSDDSWTIRYLVVETGSWLFGRKVLLSPQAITGSSDDKVLKVNLTKEQVQHSPNLDTENPLSRQEEVQLHEHYNWGGYWGAGDLWAGGIGTTGMMMAGSLPLEEAVHNAAMKDQHQEGDPHLRSTGTVKGYSIHATDGDIGSVSDFIIDDTNWTIDYLVVDTGSWLPGKKVLLSPRWIQKVEWETSSVVVDVTKEKVKNSPAYDANKSLTTAYQTALVDHYGK